MTETKSAWRLFWAPFTLGLALLAAMASTNGRLATAVSPRGIMDHQAAATGARAEDIQRAWANAHVFDFAKLSIATDLAYIGILTLGALVGCALIARRAKGGALKAVAILTGLVWIAYGATDYIETIAQWIEVNSGGTDQLASLAASMGPPKIATFLTGFAGLMVALIWHARTRPKTASSV